MAQLTSLATRWGACVQLQQRRSAQRLPALPAAGTQCSAEPGATPHDCAQHHGHCAGEAFAEASRGRPVKRPFLHAMQGRRMRALAAAAAACCWVPPPSPPAALRACNRRRLCQASRRQAVHPACVLLPCPSPEVPCQTSCQTLRERLVPACSLLPPPNPAACTLPHCPTAPCRSRRPGCTLL